MAASIPPPTQPKISHKLAVRTLILVLLLGACYFGFVWFKDKSQDLDNLKLAHTVGYLAAVQFQNDGQQVVAFTPDGKFIQSPGWSAGKTDRDITWNPSGNRVFFVSDREENNFHVFRWNPTDGSDPARRTIGSRSRSLPQFPREPLEDGDEAALITSGGFVLEYEPKDMSTRQVLPPLGREVVEATDEEGGGASDQFSGVYEKIGNSFKVARWCKGKNWIAAIMRRDEGEVLVLQSMQPNSEGRLPRPMPVAAGEHVDFDVSPKDGTIVFATQDFQWPPGFPVPKQFQKGNKITRPCAHFVGMIDPDSHSGPVAIAICKDDSVSFGAPTVSPDGASILLVTGKYENSALSPDALASAPLQPNGFTSAAKLTDGQIYEPSWSPDGQIIVFAEREASGKRALYKIQKDGSGKTNLTGDKGNFGDPVYSPQMK